MKTFCILSAFALVGTCATPKYTTRIENIKNSIQLIDSSLVVHYANTITANELKTHLYTIASKKFEGRGTGEKGCKLAAEFLKSYYQNENIASPYGHSNYYQHIPETFFSNGTKATQNVIAYIKGSEKPEEIVIVSSHFDHLGINANDEINYGADDNGSGTVALMEMAQAFNIAKKEGYPPKRSILFLHLTAEEIGKRGSEFYNLHPVFPLKNTLIDLNMDMIGRVDAIHKNNKNYIYLLGSDRLSKELHFLSEKVNNAYANLELDYRYNAENDKNDFYSRSDHYNFANNNIPVIFYFTGEHPDYHKPTDTPDKIDYQLLEKRSKLIFATAWQIANQKHKLVLDTENELLK